MYGKIIKGIGGFYYVASGHGVYSCRAKGIFRMLDIKPLIGDNVEFSIVDEKDMEGNVDRILPRKNELIRPAVSNIDAVVAVASVARPRPQLYLLDKYLVSIEMQNVPAVLVFNKCDLYGPDDSDYAEMYRKAGYQAWNVSAATGEGIEELKDFMKGKSLVFAGPSGVGKSSLTNRICPEALMETGGISRKIERGKHTTRHSEFFATEIFGEATYLLDTPGFSSLNLPEDVKTTNLCDFYTEFDPYVDYCKFAGCAHISEPVCGVKDALKDGRISPVRYENYVSLYNELKNKRIKF